jgi:hypothetical protein
MAEPSLAPAPTPAPAPQPTPVQGPQQQRRSSGPPETTRLGAHPVGTPPAGLPPTVGKLLASPGPGSPLPTSVQGPIAERLGVDPRVVQVHAGPDATEAADALGARAFAYGTHVFVGRGQRVTDLTLMAHEVAHVVQQQGGAVVQRSAASGMSNALELEARAAGTAVASGRSMRVVGRTGRPRVQGSFLGAIGRGLSAVGGAIVSGVKAAASAVADLGAAALNAALDFIKEHARSIPGYDLLSFILGKDPITQQPVERSAINLIKGLVGLIPGGAAMFENIQKAGVIQRAADWFSTEVEKLNFTWPRIRGLFQEAWDKLSASDILSPSTAWEKIKSVFGPPVRQLVDFAIAAGKKLLEFIFEGAIALGGGAAQQVLGFFRRIQSVFALIVADPVKFLSNLVAAAKGGFQNFAKNIVTHLKNALFNWLFGALAGALKLPAKFDLMGVVDIVLQVLGLTYDRFRERLVKLLGEPAVKFLEGAFEFLKILVTQGIAAAWKKLLEFATTLVDTAIGMIRDWVTTTIIGAAVKKIVLLFNPLGAIIEAIIGTYNTVMFFIEKAKEVMTLINAIVDSIENIARGNIGGAVAYVEKMLASALVVLINFLARYIGLSKVADAIKGTIKKIQDTVWGAIDKVLDWVKKSVQGLLGKKEGSDTPGKPALMPEKEFDESGEHHKLYLKVEGSSATPMIASTPETLLDFLKKAEDSGIPADQKKNIAAARTIVNQMGDLAKQIVSADPKSTAMDAQRAKLQELETQLSPLLKALLSDVDLKKFNEIYSLEGITGQYAQMPTQRRDLLTPDHQPQAALLEYAAENVMVSTSGAGSRTSVFKGMALEAAAAGHGSGGMTINLFHKRHVAGRTYGGKSASSMSAPKSDLDKISAMSLPPEQKRAKAVAVLKAEAAKDVKAMLDVVSAGNDDVIWEDVRQYNLKKEKDVRIKKLRDQIKAGEQALLGQNFDRFK